MEMVCAAAEGRLEVILTLVSPGRVDRKRSAVHRRVGAEVIL